MAVASFGFSVGDFVAGIQLIHKAVKALRTASGATAQYQQAMSDLDLIAVVLRRVQSLTPATASQETIRAVQLCGHACHLPLASFLNKIKRLEPYLSLENKSDKTRLARSSRKLQWALTLEEDVAKLKASIGPGIEIMNTILQIEALERGEITKEDMRRVLRQTETILSSVDRVAFLLQNNHATWVSINEMNRNLSHQTSRLSQTTTSQEVQYLITASANHSTSINNKTTKDQVNGMEKFIQDIREEENSVLAALTLLNKYGMSEISELGKIAKDSHSMLVSLSDRVPPATDTAGQQLSKTIRVDTCQPQRSSPDDLKQNAESLDIKGVHVVFEALRNGLISVIFIFLWLNAAFKICSRTLAKIPRSPTLLLDSNITFVDALDRHFSLQYQQFRYWPVVLAWLECQFRDCPGSLRITHQDFAIFKDMRSSGRGMVILPEEWECSVFLGQCVFMSMHFSRQSREQEDGQYIQACPSCGYVTQLDGMQRSVWIKCADCSLLFIRMDVPPEVSAQKPPRPADRVDNDTLNGTEISAFRRVHHFTQAPPLGRRPVATRRNISRRRSPPWRLREPRPRDDSSIG